MAKFYEAGTLVYEDEIPLSRRHAVGQGVRFNYTDYKVISSRLDSGMELVGVIPAEICTKCGGVKGNAKNHFECVCP